MDGGYLMLRGGWFGVAGACRLAPAQHRDGTFTDVTEEAGLLSFHPHSRRFDYDSDGWLDVSLK
jgi:hypothetical protein